MGGQAPPHSPPSLPQLPPAVPATFFSSFSKFCPIPASSTCGTHSCSPQLPVQAARSELGAEFPAWLIPPQPLVGSGSTDRARGATSAAGLFINNHLAAPTRLLPGCLPCSQGWEPQGTEQVIWTSPRSQGGLWGHSWGLEKPPNQLTFMVWLNPLI